MLIRFTINALDSKEFCEMLNEMTNAVNPLQYYSFEQIIHNIKVYFLHIAKALPQPVDSMSCKYYIYPIDVHQFIDMLDNMANKTPVSRHSFNTIIQTILCDFDSICYLE